MHDTYRYQHAAPKRHFDISSNGTEQDEAGPYVRVAFASLILIVLFISFKPFYIPPENISERSLGDLSNQLGFGFVGILAVLSLIFFANTHRIRSMFSIWWLLLVAMFALSILRSNDPMTSIRGAYISITIIIAIVSTLAVTRNINELSNSFKIASLTIILTCYLGVFLMPDAIHSATGNEPQHVGLWRGSYPHKNMAGPVLGFVAYVGLYMFRRGERVWGIFFMVAGLFFVLKTGSKTTMALIPASMFLVLVPSIMGIRGLVVINFSILFIAMALFTLGTTYIAPLGDLAHAFIPDLTFTGRATLWDFGGDMVMKKPWLGYGYGGFWLTDVVQESDLPFDRAWDFRDIVHGHNGYMDAAIYMGLPTVFLILMVFIVSPMRDYLATPRTREGQYLSDFFMMVTVFVSTDAFLESFFFNRADPVWVMCLIPVLGLRACAHSNLVPRY